MPHSPSVPTKAGPHLKHTTSTKAGAHRAARMVFPVWPKLCDALVIGLCLADSWIPAFAGMDMEADEK